MVFTMISLIDTGTYLGNHLLCLPNNIVLPMTLKCNYLKPSGKERTGQHVKWHEKSAEIAYPI